MPARTACASSRISPSSSAIADDERELLTRAVLEHVAGRVPVIVTTTHYSRASAPSAAAARRTMGAAMVMVMPPYHGATFRVPEAGIHEFFRRLAERIGIPIMIQDAPASGTPLSAPFLARMAREIGRSDTSRSRCRGGRGQAARMIALGGAAIEGPWDGEEAITLIADLEAGATGCDDRRRLPDGHASRSSKTAAPAGATRPFAGYERWLPLINCENRQCGLLAAKALMKEGGIIACEAPRHPLPPLHPETRASLLATARRLDPLVLRWAR